MGLVRRHIVGDPTRAVLLVDRRKLGKTDTGEVLRIDFRDNPYFALIHSQGNELAVGKNYTIPVEKNK